MGAVLSYIWGPQLPEDWDTPDPVSGISLHHKQAIKDTWALVLPQMRATGIALFLAFFEAHPEHQVRFSAFATVPLAELPHNKRLAAHASSVIHALAAVIDALEDPECLHEMLIKVANTHKAHSIPKSAFSELKAVFLQLMRDSLGNKLTPVAEEAWDIVFTYVNKVICDNM